MAKGIEGLDRLQAKLEKARKAGRAAAQGAVRAQAERLANRMRAVVPVDQMDLHDSITVTTEGQRTPSYSHPGGSHVVPSGAAEITAGNTTVRYAHLVEYGTQAAEAQPFFWPVVRAERRRARTGISRAVGKAIRESVK